MEGFDKFPVRISKGENSYDLHVMWAIHNKCNYACSYCPADLHEGKTSWLRLEELKGFIDRVENHYVKRLGFKNILFSFTGGEPTLWKDFKPFIDYISKKGFRCGLTTNGSVSVNFWKNISHAFDYICLSFHPESAELKRFLDTFKFLHDDVDTVIPSVRVMMHKEQKYWDRSAELIKRLRKFPNWTYECVHILENYGTDSQKIVYDSKKKTKFLEEHAFQEQYLDDTKVVIPKVNFTKYTVENNDGTVEKLNENKLISDNQTNFKGWNCFIGIEQLFIHHTGHIRTAGCPAGKSLGHILVPELIRFPTEPTICNTDSCYCPTDIRISKSAPNLEPQYKIPDDTSSLSKIGTNGSYFQYKITLNVEMGLLNFYPKIDEYVNQVNDYIDHISISKNIPIDRILVNFNCVNDIDFNRTPDFFTLLGKIKGYKNLKLILKSIIPDSFITTVTDNFPFITIDSHSARDLACINKFLNEMQSKPKSRLLVRFSCEIEKDIIAAVMIKKFLALYRYMEMEINVTTEHKALQKLISKNSNGNVFSQFLNFDDGHRRYDLRHRLILNETTQMENGRLDTFIGELKHVENFHDIQHFKGWKCEIGKSHTAISPNGDILSSFCKDGQYLGSIKTKTTNFKHGHCTTCTQDKCPDIIYNVIPKEKI